MSFPKAGGYQVALHLILVGLASLVVVLVAENRDLRSPRASPPSASPAVGDLLPPIDAKNLEGHDVKLTFNDADRETMLFVFTTSCPACRGNLPNWLAFEEQLGEHFNVVGISIDSMDATRSYVRDQALPFEVFVPTDPDRFRSDYSLPGVPETLHAGVDGRVEGSWLGVLPEGFLEGFATQTVELAEGPTESGAS